MQLNPELPTPEYAFSLANLEEQDANYLAYCIEQSNGSDTSRFHLQGVIQFKTERKASYQTTRKRIQSLFEQRKGESIWVDQRVIYDLAEYVEKYLKKENNKIYQIGRKRCCGSNRFYKKPESHKELCKKILKCHEEGKMSIREMKRRWPHAIHIINALKEFRYRPRDKYPNLLYIYSKTGKGKSANVRQACREAGIDVYTKTSGLKWFQGYEHEHVIILDEFAGGFPLCQFLQICDDSMVSIEVKGSSVEITSPFIIILTNTKPEDQYMSVKEKNENSWQAYLRRVLVDGTYIDLEEFEAAYREENPDEDESGVSLATYYKIFDETIKMIEKPLKSREDFYMFTISEERRARINKQLAELHKTRDTKPIEYSDSSLEMC